jgi:hypothetical protein
VKAATDLRRCFLIEFESVPVADQWKIRGLIVRVFLGKLFHSLADTEHVFGQV